MRQFIARQQRLFLLTLGLSGFLMGCGSSDPPPATVDSAAVRPAEAASPADDASAALPQPPLAAVELEEGRGDLNSENTAVTIRSGAVGANAAGMWQAGFAELSGRLQVDGDRLTALTVEIDATSLQAPDAQLKQDLTGAEFLNTAEFPTAHFEMTSAEASTQAAESEQDSERTPGLGKIIHVTGNLTLAGHTQEITAPAVVQVQEGRATVSISMQLDRDAFGMAPYQEDVQNTFRFAIEIGRQEELL